MYVISHIVFPVFGCADWLLLALSTYQPHTKNDAARKAIGMFQLPGYCLALEMEQR